jgi:hypothetical protein
VRWGEIRVHDLNLADILSRNYDVDIAIYTPHYAYRARSSNDILGAAKKKYNVYEKKSGFIERQFVRLSRILSFICVPHPLLFTGLTFSFWLRYYIGAQYEFIIPIEHYSLYCAWRAFSSHSNKIIYYSLEVNTVNDNDINSYLRVLLAYERRILQRIYGLIIQDEFRAAVIAPKGERRTLKEYYLPVFSMLPRRTEKSSYLRDALRIPSCQRILLYFGAFYAERKIDEIIAEFLRLNRDDLCLVLHSPDINDSSYSNLNINLRYSSIYVESDRIDELISSADIGLALYDNEKPNTRFTAFSSEKVTTYLRSGLPFIAFQNESYQKLSELYECCATISKIGDLESAINKLLAEYQRFSSLAYDAYEDIFQRKILTL